MTLYAAGASCKVRDRSAASSHHICGGVSPLMLLAPLAPAVPPNHSSLNRSCVSCSRFTQHGCCWKTNPLSPFNLPSLRVATMASSSLLSQKQICSLWRKREQTSTDSGTSLVMLDSCKRRLKHFPPKSLVRLFDLVRKMSLEGTRPLYQTRISPKCTCKSNNTDWICSTERLAGLLEVNAD